MKARKGGCLLCCAPHFLRKDIIVRGEGLENFYFKLFSWSRPIGDEGFSSLKSVI